MFKPLQQPEKSKSMTPPSGAQGKNNILSAVVIYFFFCLLKGSVKYSVDYGSLI